MISNHLLKTQVLHLVLFFTSPHSHHERRYDTSRHKWNRPVSVRSDQHASHSMQYGLYASVLEQHVNPHHYHHYSTFLKSSGMLQTIYVLKFDCILSHSRNKPYTYAAMSFLFIKHNHIGLSK